MSSKSKRIGTAGETAVRKVFTAAGFENAIRAAQTGIDDSGDIRVHEDLIVQVKAGAAAQNASLNQIRKWLGETDQQRKNAGVHQAVLVVQRQGYGLSRADQWEAWAQMSAGREGQMHPVCFTLEMFILMLKRNRWVWRMPL